MYCIIKFMKSVCAIVAMAVTMGTPAQGASEPVQKEAAQMPKDVGLWVWPRNVVKDTAERDALLAFCEKHGITRLLVQVHFDKEASPPQLAYPAEVQDLLSKAAAKGIAVEALDGAPEMGLETNRAKTLSYLDAVLKFHQQQPKGKGFAGIHYDIEPHLSKRWRDGDEKSVALETLGTMLEIQQHVKAADPALTLAHDIPMWFDARGESLTLEFNGASKNLHQHIQDLSDYVGIMSYRLHATGPNSVSAVCEQELAYAQKTGKKLYASLETGQLKSEPEITFYGHKPEEFIKVRDEVVQKMSESPAFGGILLHHYGAVRDLLEGTKTEDQE